MLTLVDVHFMYFFFESTQVMIMNLFSSERVRTRVTNADCQMETWAKARPGVS